MEICSVTDKRLIISVSVNGHPTKMLVDTGASVSMIDEEAAERFKVRTGRVFNNLVGYGGEQLAHYAKDMDCECYGIKFHQFVISILSNIIESIKNETGMTISGIIGLPSLKMAEVRIICNENKLVFGYES